MSYILKILNIKENEKQQVFLLMLYSFFMGAVIAFFIASSTSIFIEEFGKEFFAYSYIASGIISFILSHYYIKIQKQIKYKNVVIGGLLFLALSLLIIILFQIITQNKIFIFILYIWIGVLAYIHAISFWGVASKLFSLQQGKRLFGLISSGEVVSLIISFFSIPILLKFIEVKVLLFFTVIGVLSALIIMIIILRKYSDKLETKKPTSTVEEKQKTKKKQPLFKNKYFFYIFMLALLPMFSNYFVDFIFNMQIKSEFENAKIIAGFLGVFFGATSIIELIVKTFASGRLLNKYGLKLGLLTLPVTLFFSVTLSGIIGLFFGTEGMFFSFVALTRVFMRVSKTAINDPAFQILYQPIPQEQRLAFQSKIEGTPKSLGTSLAGVALLLFTAFDFFTLTVLNLIFLILLFYWIRVSSNTFDKYRQILKDLISKSKSNKQKKSDHSNTNSELIIDNTILATNNIYTYLYLLKNINLNLFYNKTEFIYNYVSDDYKSEIEKYLLENIEFNVLKSINQDFKTKNHKYNKYIELIKTRDSENIIKLSTYGNYYDKSLVIKIIENSKRYFSVNVFKNLTIDNNLIIRNKAIYSSSLIDRKELWENIIYALSVPKFALTAFHALKNIGTPILDELEKAFIKYEKNQNAQLYIVELYKEIGTNKSIKHLRNKINYPNTNIRINVIKALGALNYKVNSLESPVIETAMEEQLDLYVWNLHAINEISNIQTNEELTEALYFELENKKLNIYSFLANLYDTNAVELIRNNLQYGKPQEKAYAMEIADMILSDANKELLLPILENSPIEQTIEKYKYQFNYKTETLNNRLLDVLNKDYTAVNCWTKALAIEKLIELHPDNLESILLSNIPNPNKIIREIAAHGLYNMFPNDFFEKIIEFKTLNIKELNELTYKIQKRNDKKLITINIIRELKKIDFFKKIPEFYFIDAIESSNLLTLEKNQNKKISADIFANKLYYIVNGNLTIINEAEDEIQINNNYIWNIFDKRLNHTDINLQANEETVILEFDSFYIYKALYFNKILLENFYKSINKMK